MSAELSGPFVVYVRERVRDIENAGWRELGRRDRGAEAVDLMMELETRYPAEKFEMSIGPADFKRA